MQRLSQLLLRAHLLLEYDFEYRLVALGFAPDSQTLQPPSRHALQNSLFGIPAASFPATNSLATGRLLIPLTHRPVAEGDRPSLDRNRFGNPGYLAISLPQAVVQQSVEIPFAQAHQERGSLGAPYHDLVHRLQRLTYLPVDGEHGLSLLAQDADANGLVGARDKPTRSDGVRANGGDDQRLDAWIDDRPPGRERVSGRARRRGDNHAVRQETTGQRVVDV